MADAVDMATDIVAEHLARGIAAARAPFDPGVAGECEGCGDEFPRLIGGKCGYCRDGRRRPAQLPSRAWVLEDPQPVGKLESVADPDSIASDVAPPGASVPMPTPPAVAVAAPRRSQINAKVTQAEYDQVVAMAQADGTSISTVTSALVAEALAARARLGKPVISAAVVRAAAVAGVPVVPFVGELIAAGLAMRAGQGA